MVVFFDRQNVEAGAGESLTLLPASSGTDNLIGATNTSWVFTATTTAELARGDVLQFVFPDVVGTDFDLSNISITATSGIEFYSGLGSTLSNLYTSNASFESATSSWDIAGGGVYSVTPTTTAYNGSMALELYAETDGYLYFTNIVSGVATGTDYTFSVYAKGAVGNEQLFFMVDANEADCLGGLVSHYNFTSSTWTCASSPDFKIFAGLTTEFARYTVTVPSHVLSDVLHTGFGIFGPGTVVIDAVQIEEASSATAFNLGGTTSDTPGIVVGGTGDLVVAGMVNTTTPSGTNFSVTFGGISNPSGTLIDLSNLSWTVKAGTPASTVNLPGAFSGADKINETSTESVTRAGSNLVANDNEGVTASSAYISSSNVNYTYVFQATSSVPVGGKVVLNFPTAYDLGSVTVNLSQQISSLSSTTIASFATSTGADAKQVILTTAGEETSAGSVITVTIGGITNPSTATTYSPFYVYTTKTNSGLLDGAVTLGDSTNYGPLTISLPMPGAPTSFVTTTVSATAIGWSWADNSSGEIQEDNFILDYILSSGSFPGTTSTVVQDATSTSVSSLIPNTSYQFRIAAENTHGTSGYATSSAEYTAAAVPLTVTGVANGQTSLIVTWGANSNPTSTVYELYNAGVDTSIATTTLTTYTVTGLTAATAYTFKVRALYNSDSTTWSAFATTSTEVTTDSISTSVETTLGTTVSTTFQFTGGTEHTVTLNSVVEGVSANLTIASTPVTQDFSEGVADNIDSDGNGADDMTVTASDITATGATIALALYTPPVVDTPAPSSGGGGGSVAVSAPILGIAPVTYSSAIDANNIILFFNVSNATQVAISDNSSFVGSSWQTYQTQKSVLVNPGETTKILYIKFRSSSGGETAVQSLIVQVNSNVVSPVPAVADLSGLAKVDVTSLVKISGINRQSFVQGEYLSFKYYFINNTGKMLPLKVTRNLVNKAGKTVLVSNATAGLRSGGKFSRSVNQNFSTRLPPGIYTELIVFYDARTGKKMAENSFDISLEKKKLKRAVLKAGVTNADGVVVFDLASLKSLKKAVALPHSFRLKYSFKNITKEVGYFDLVREIVDQNGKVWQKNTGLWRSGIGQVRNINIPQVIPTNLPAGDYVVRIRFSPRGKSQIVGENSLSFTVTVK